MKSYYTITGWNKMYGCHYITDGKDSVLCDLFIDCDESIRKYKDTPEELTGKRIKMSYEQPYITIGVNVSLE